MTPSERKSIPEQKTCTKCFVAKPIGQFPKSKKGKYGFSSRCHACTYLAQKDWQNRNPEKHKAICRTSYLNHKARCIAFGRQYRRDKRAESYAEWAERVGKDKVHSKIVNLGFRKFGITQEWFNAKLASQNFLCAICGINRENQNWSRFSIDHDHDCCGSERACDKCRRDLLCHRCNIRLGMIENSEWMSKAFSYLLKHGKDLSLVHMALMVPSEHPAKTP